MPLSSRQIFSHTGSVDFLLSLLVALGFYFLFCVLSLYIAFLILFFSPMLLISKFIFSFSARPPPVFPFIKQILRYITAEIILTEQNKAADPTRGHF